jgi:hypothetical protein
MSVTTFALLKLNKRQQPVAQQGCCALKQVVLQRHLIQPLKVHVWNKPLLWNKKCRVLQLLISAQGSQNPDDRIHFLLLAFFHAKNNSATLREQKGCCAPAQGQKLICMLTKSTHNDMNSQNSAALASVMNMVLEKSFMLEARG